MNSSSSESDCPSSDKTTYTTDLATWTEASFELFMNFKKVRNCLSQNKIPAESESVQSDYIGQCPKDQILALVMAMESELDRLLQDLEHLSKVSQADYKKNHPRLLSQTATLNQLNQQAKNKLLLTTLSAT